MCISSMIAKASELGCSATDIPCLCKNPDFANGLHDCTVEACGGADYPAVQAYGASYCASTLSSNLPSSVNREKKLTLGSLFEQAPLRILAAPGRPLMSLERQRLSVLLLVPPVLLCLMLKSRQMDQVLR
jgi:CFEM domain